MEIYRLKTRCTGCGACKSVCPVNAISMQEDDRGFLYPVVDKEKCIDCGKCRKTCPTYEEPNNLKERTVYSYTHPDQNVLMNSSSGGAFSLICAEVQKIGGYICGPVFEGRKLKHAVTRDPALIQQMRGSKYLQSDSSSVHYEIKELLANGEYVLFSGTPCQVVGLKRFLSKEYENLLTVDNVCHSVPSPLIFRKYIEMLEDEHGDKFEHINFRDKKEGWEKYSLRIQFEKSEVYSPHHGNLYMEGFLDGLYTRPSCSDCLVKKNTGYVSDITLGDFWGIRDIDVNQYDSNGVSAVVINTEKGAELLKHCELLHQECFDDFVRVNSAYSNCATVSEREKAFWRIFERCGLRKTFQTVYKVPFSIKVKTIIKKMIMEPLR